MVPWLTISVEDECDGEVLNMIRGANVKFIKGQSEKLPYDEVWPAYKEWSGK